MLEVGDKIRQLRLNKKWLQKELADKTGLSVQKISNIERGYNKDIRSEDISIIAKAFNVSTDFILNPDVPNQKELLILADRLALACQQVLDSNIRTVSEFILLMEKALLEYNNAFFSNKD